MAAVHHRYAAVRGRRLFYREAGAAGGPAVVLLHGFPASSFMFRDLDIVTDHVRRFLGRTEL